MQIQREITNRTTEIETTVSSEWFPVAFSSLYIDINHFRKLCVTHATVNGNALETL
jgi:hypothetical protein